MIAQDLFDGYFFSVIFILTLNLLCFHINLVEVLIAIEDEEICLISKKEAVVFNYVRSILTVIFPNLSENHGNRHNLIIN